MPDKRKIILLFLGVFLFRLFFGLCQAKWMEVDQLQTYLIGLKFYTTGAWPYFGPDVNGIENSFQSQTPGALEGLLVGLPFYLLPIPEAPFIFLNLMTAAGVLLLAGYLHRRIPALPFGWLCLWLTVAPWSLQEATFVLNPDYIFLPSVLFFIGFMEATPPFSQRWMPSPWANALMGFSLFFIMQFHFSYVYLVPLAVFSFLTQIRESRKPLARGPQAEGQALGVPGQGAKSQNGPGPLNLLYFILGALPPLSLAVPTYLKYGIASGNVASGFAVPFNWVNVREFWTILARFLSLVCFEMPRFIGQDNAERFDFLKSHPLLLVPGAFLWVAGLIQPFILLLGWFKKEHSSTGWKETKWLTLALLGIVEVSFWFTLKQPIAHIYFILFPFIMAYSCYVWALFTERAPWPTVAKVFLVVGFVFQLGFAWVRAPQWSIYPQRAQVAKAIQEKNYHLMGERRSGSIY